MALPRKFIDSIHKAKQEHAQKTRFNPRRRLNLTYVHKEPEGWPLKRPATRPEWSHVLKVMIMRRVPKVGPIHRTKLIRYVSADLEAASAAGRIYVDGDFMAMRNVLLEIGRMCGNDQTLRADGRMEDEEIHGFAPAIYRTEFAEEWLKLVPVTVQAVVDFLPTTNLLDMMVQALIDDEVSDD